ncbi:MAG: hypothetical protein ACIARQ_03870 [Phycisphaerales bacterium JB061]
MTQFTHKKQASSAPNEPPPEGADPPAHEPLRTDDSIAFIRDDFPEYHTIPKHIARANMHLTYSLVAVVLTFTGVLGIAISAIGVGTTLLIACGAIALVVILVTLITRDVRSTFDLGGAIHARIPYESLKSPKRIHICVRPKLALRIIHALPDARHGFEPEIARVPLALGFDDSTKKLATIGWLTGLAAAAVGLTVFGWDRVHFAVMFWFAMGMGVLGSVVIPEFFFPTYVRVIPGRLDVIRAPLLGSSMHTLASIDLRKRPLMLNEVALFAEPERPPGTPRPAKVWSKKWNQGMVHPPECNPEAVSLIMSPARRRLVLAIAQAAVTDAPTPVMPSDQLTG